MAKMSPPIIPSDTPSYSEKEIYSLLQNDPLTHDWIVLHSLDTANHLKNIISEVDFGVIIRKHQGVLSWSGCLPPFQVELIDQIGFCAIHAFKGVEAEVVVGVSGGK